MARLAFVAVTEAQLELSSSLHREELNKMAEPLAAHEPTAKLACQPGEQWGRPFGSPEVDWFAAEKALRSAQRDPKLDLLYGITLEANERPFDSGGSANQK